MPPPTAMLRAAVEARHADLVELYRRLHRHPELGLQLPATQAVVLDRLSTLPVETRVGRSSSAVAVLLRAASSDRPPVLLRADMDALPLQEESGVPFASTVPGVMHACGHDAHTAMLLVAAEVLCEMRERLPGDVVLLFQAGEEGHDGCRIALADGLLEGGFAPARAYALHQAPHLPSGTVWTRGGPLFASADGVRLHVLGRTGHVALPHQALDPVPVLCEAVLALQHAVTRRFDVFDPVVITVNRMVAGTPGAGVIPATAEAEGTVRAFSEAARARAGDVVRSVVSGVAAAHGCQSRVDVVPGYPVTVNDPVEADRALAVAREVVGTERAHSMPTPVPASEDFAYLLQRVPGAMLALGTARAGEPVTPVHSAQMRLDEDALLDGAALLAALAL